MGDAQPNGSAVRFGAFEVDLRAGELRKQGIRIKLQDQPFQVLQVLLERPGEVVTREELQQRIWPPDTFVDFDHGLHNAIKKLREALSDSAETPRYIETLPKRGYRFIGPVKPNDRLVVTAVEANKGVASNPTAATQLPQTSAGAQKHVVKFLAAASGLALIFGLLSVFNAGSARNRLLGRGNPPLIHSLAVLPFENLSDDPAQKYFSYGMTEELTTELAQISGVKVISHTSTIRYENNSKPLPQIARELGVDGVVEGAVQRSGNQARITVQLIYAPEDKHVWAETYDRDFRNVLELQSNVAAAIVGHIRAQTGSPAPIPRTKPASPNLQALEAYLQGNYSLERMGSGAGYDGYKAAISYFKQAISEDPNFAAAYEKLADTYDASFAWRPNEIMPLEKATLEKALELDPGSAGAHLANAHIKINYDCDLPGAEREYKEAIRLNPNLADAHGLFSDYLHTVGREEESIREAQRAQELDPEGMHESGILMATGQFDRVIALLRKHLELHPDDGFAYIDSGLIDAYHFAGRHRESVEAMQKAWTLFGFEDIGKGVGKAYAASGYAGALRYSAQELERLYREGKVYKPDYIASWYARAGDKEQSLKWLKVDLADNNHCWAGLDRDPDFTFLRSDPRFQELVRRPMLPQ
jgi:TolB-like protein/DNA-binding winged helix-turn-helix (wHTH) protein